MSLPGTPETAFDELREVVGALQSEARKVLGQLVAIESLSKPGSDPEVLQRSAEYVRELFAPLCDWDVCEIVSAPGGAPAVLARKEPQPGYPTVLLYAHHDVQPTGDLALWSSPPSELTQRDGRLYGRGSADDGAGIVTHYSALRALVDTRGATPGIGVVVFIEGEEESGSPTFANLLEAHHDTLRADVIVVADSDNPAPDRPAITTSLRGVVGCSVTVRTLSAARHSGLFGGPVPDALGVLTRLLATLYRADGSVAIAGLETAPIPVSGIDDEALRAESGLLPGIELWGEGELALRLWRQPSVTITGMDVPRVSEASNTLIPQATARLSIRIPPGVDSSAAMAAIEGHLRDHTPAGVRLEIADWEAGEGFDQSLQHPLMELMAQSLEWGFGAPVSYQGVGGTIPFVAYLQAAFPGVPIAVTGVEDRQSAAHGIDESVDIAMLERAAAAEARFLVSLEERRTQEGRGQSG